MYGNSEKENYEHSGRLLPPFECVLFATNQYRTKKSGHMSSRNQIANVSVLMGWNQCPRTHKTLKISNSRDMKLATTKRTEPMIET